MITKLFIIIALLIIVYALISSFYYLIKDKGTGTRTVKRLSWRVALSLVLFVLLFVALLTGWIQPGSGDPVRYPVSAESEKP